MAVSTQGGKKTIYPQMLYILEGDMGKDEEVVEGSGELVEKMAKQVEVSHKFVPIPRTLHHSMEIGKENERC